MHSHFIWRTSNSKKAREFDPEREQFGFGPRLHAAHIHGVGASVLKYLLELGRLPVAGILDRIWYYTHKEFTLSKETIEVSLVVISRDESTYLSYSAEGIEGADYNI